MRIPVEWLKEYIDIEKTPKEIAKSFTALGLLLDKPIENGVLDLEHRMDRSDWLSILGCARDLAAFEGLKLKHPEVYEKKGKKPTKDQIVDIQVECPEIVKRFNTVVFRGVKVKKSPAWLKNRLETYGIPSINNIVDITNYVMVELGQPMHTQDLNKMEAQEIVIRKAKKGEKVKTLLGETVEVGPDQFVLTQKGKPTVIGGIVGGESTGVDENTTDIVLDAGNYDQNNIRKSSRQLKIQNETVLRYDKFLHPELAELAIKRATKLILELAEGEHYENIDWYPKKAKTTKMQLRLSRLEQVSGIQFGMKDVKRILTALEYVILEETKDKLELEVPYFRTDVVVEDDLVADILRINDYENVPIAQIDKAPPTEITPEIYKFENKLKDICVNLGLHEHITDPLISHKENDTNAVLLENALSSEKNSLRTSAYSTLLPVTVNYVKQGYDCVNVFEIGKTYAKTVKSRNKLPFEEKRVLQAIVGGVQKPQEKAPIAKKLLSGFLVNIGINNAIYKKTDNVAAILVGKTELGTLTYDGFTLETEQLMKFAKKTQRVITENKNQHTEDISLIMNLTQPLGEIFYEILTDKNVVSIDTLEDTPRKINREDKRTVLLRITYIKEWNREKTLSTLKTKYKVMLRA
jgi:phenylalanyl-tRNA synthetase beta chain